MVNYLFFWFEEILELLDLFVFYINNLCEEFNIIFFFILKYYKSIKEIFKNRRKKEKNNRRRNGFKNEREIKKRRFCCDIGFSFLLFFWEYE